MAIQSETHELTGNYYFKPTIFGHLALYVEETSTYDGYSVTAFRRGRLEDIFALGLVNNTA